MANFKKGSDSDRGLNRGGIRLRPGFESDPVFLVGWVTCCPRFTNPDWFYACYPRFTSRIGFIPVGNKLPTLRIRQPGDYRNRHPVMCGEQPFPGLPEQC